MEHLRRLGRDDRGFTLIELLVVVVVIGILIAIAIPLYLNSERSGYDASTKVDIHTVVLDEGRYNANHDTYGTTAQLVADNPSLKMSKGTFTLILASDADHYCMAAYNTNGPHDSSSPLQNYGLPDDKVYFYRSDTGRISTTPCTTSPHDSNQIGDDGLH